MKPFAWILFSSTLFASVAVVADEPAPQKELAAVVQRAFLTPYARREAVRSSYSRMAMPAAARRLRVLDKAPVEDATGRLFYTFAVDERRFGDWQKAAMTGCVYLDKGEVFVKRGKLRPAAAYLGGGKKVADAPETACVSRHEKVAAR